MPNLRGPRTMGLSNKTASFTSKKKSDENSSAAMLRARALANYEIQHDPYRGIMSVDEQDGLADALCPWSQCQFISEANDENRSSSEAQVKVALTSHCACPSLIAWTEKHDEDQRKRTNRRKRKLSKTKDPVEPLGKRPEDPKLRCACDYNPLCLASLGGVMDELLAQKAKEVLPEEENSDPRESQSSEVIDIDGGETDTEEPEPKKRKTPSPTVEIIEVKQDRFDPNNEHSIYSQITAEQLKCARQPCRASSTAIQKYVQNSVLPHTTTSLTIAEYMDHLQRLQKPLLFANPILTNDDSATSTSVTLALPPGIQNLGATCYLNTQLQCLARNLVFLDGIFSWRPSEAAGNNNQSLHATMNSVLSTLQLLLARMAYGGAGTVTTEDFSKALGLENDEMQDPNEFARLLFERMHESFMNNAGLSNLLPSLFQGVMAYETTCMNCQTVSQREEEFMDLNLPIMHPSGDSPVKKTGQLSILEAFGTKADTNVQYCLDQYLRPEELSGDNQYWCETCRAKRDAQRAVTFHKLPPVLNVQISRYVFDRTKFVKKKLSDNVLLPRVLHVPQKGDKESTPYLLCAVMKHQGTSAYQGHYVAEAMEWHSGTWFEFNDEKVAVLADGPSCSYDPQEYHTGDGKKPPAGSKDAYNMYYVREPHLAEAALQSIVRTPQKAKAPQDSRPGVVEEVTRERSERYQVLEGLCLADGKIAGRLTRRRTELLQTLSTTFAHPWGGLSFRIARQLNTRSNSPVWVDGDVLRQFFACHRETESSASSSHSPALRHKHLLCEHGVGLRPRVARRGKLLPRPIYDAYAALLQREGEEKSCQVGDTNDCIISPQSNLYCGECAAAYREELSTKLKTLKRLKRLHADLDPSLAFGLSLGSESSDTDDGEEFIYCVSKKFATKFRSIVASLVKTLESGETQSSGTKLPIDCLTESICEGLDALDLSRFLPKTSGSSCTADTAKDPAPDIEGLDPFVNTAITCEHGKLSVTTDKRNMRCYPESVWKSLKVIFPRAITHKRKRQLCESMSTFGRDRYPEHCPDCRNEEAEKEEMGVRLRSWATETLSSLPNNLLKGQRSMDEVMTLLCDDSVISDSDMYLVYRDDLDVLQKALTRAKSKRDSYETKEYLENLFFGDRKASLGDSYASGDPEPPEFEEQLVERLCQRWTPRSLVCREHRQACQSALFPAESDFPDQDCKWLAELNGSVEPLTRTEYVTYIGAIYNLGILVLSLDGEEDGQALKDPTRVNLSRIVVARVKALSTTHHVVIRSPATLVTSVASVGSSLLPTDNGEPRGPALHVCKDPTCNASFLEEQKRAEHAKTNGKGALKTGVTDIVDMTSADDEPVGDSLCLRVYEIDGKENVKNCISSIWNQSSEPLASAEHTFLRRSSRKRKTKYPSGPVLREDVLNVQLFHNLAAIRLFMMEKCPDFALDDHLTLVLPLDSSSERKPSSGEPTDELVDSDDDMSNEYICWVLPFEWNEKSLEDVLKEAPTLGQDIDSVVSRMFLCRQTAAMDGSDTKTAKKKKQQEDASLMDSVFEIANTSTENTGSGGASNGKASKKRRVERGFRGTFLHALSSAEPKSGESKNDDGSEDKSNGDEAAAKELDQNEVSRRKLDSDEFRVDEPTVEEEKEERFVENDKKDEREPETRQRPDTVVLVDESEDETGDAPSSSSKRRQSNENASRAKSSSPIGFDPRGCDDNMSEAASHSLPVADAAPQHPHRDTKERQVLDNLMAALTRNDMGPVYDQRCRRAVKWAVAENEFATIHELVDVSFAKYLEGEM